MRKIVWLVVSCLMVAALLLASCGPAAEEEEEVVVTPEEEEVVTEEEVVVTEEKEMVRDSLGRLVEKPRYGGTFVLARGDDIWSFDEAAIQWNQAVCYSLHLTNEELVTGDWTKGAIGTGEAGWRINEFFGHLSVPLLAESWEIPDDETVIFHLQKGVHYALNPASEASQLVGGRELVADDVVWSWNQVFVTPGVMVDIYTPEQAAVCSVTAPDKYTVVVKWLPGYARETLRHVGDYCSIMPPEVAEEYGDFSEWQNSVGTGPFMLVDYVPGSSVTFVRNPNYWRQHPLYGDQMPYLDGVKWLIIPDSSTRMSAMRTGKIDLLGVGWENAKDIAKTNPELTWASSPPTMSALLFMRTDKPELPFYDQRVRQALQLGLNNQEIIDEYYGGNAVLVNHPLVPMPEFEGMYTPLEELPGTVQELYGYDPEKAKQLLAEAGYPDGFTTEIICSAGFVDLLSIVKYDWEQIGVTLNLEVKEGAVYNSMGYRRNHKEMYIGYGIDSTPSSWVNFGPDNTGNRSMIDDPRVNEAIEDWLRYSSDWDKLCQIARDIYPYILEQAWTVPMPAAYSYTAWWPWLKDYHGEDAVGYYNWSNYSQYLWLDQDLKKEMGY